MKTNTKKNPKFEETLERMKNFHHKKEQRMTDIKRNLHRKFTKELTASPTINRNYRLEGDFYSRMDEDNYRRDLKNNLDVCSERIQFLKPEVREMTFSPKINPTSISLNRSIK